ncbi:glycerophosphodiester phosphodiesterase [Leptospira borgpetersenii]|uniref:Glycerophosphodiester phosphodiesterase family protein n=2 Tax=Leptospira borgpetersenii serovar Hardjo-bovis TaxID=338217 RepID=M6BNG1_LEPBO|nr:glycerophosphodiester phosphodiesterase [Leptospira borgpetersenii]AMX57186.1 glycerophosphoryl diester phosphodiesterase [Leptospira borgpetersenii serovar Hardjo]AMX60417.1 glycerophosphoryl diester phosphodiesterase [Leptospira borgpetersenii serovar Hardjo]AMX63664.1 glycerophosphoryl diester phosphodiesterase [Leptospira borgpetersenii serovar Hardjo]AMX66903.1 glycerophosphoryl diester phosphodiesterase [Leptospira borgpetersenii serovar Hardjo]AMX72403.1 glycerophosphoryl diester pho
MEKNPFKMNAKIKTWYSLEILFVLILCFGVNSCSNVPIINKPLNKSLDLQGHRGARGLRPENTWPAFEEAIRYGMTTLELDTVLTKDNKIIIHHDSFTNPTICQKKDGTQIVSTSLYELTLSELKQLDCGAKKNPKYSEQIPVPGTELITIEEFFTLVANAEKKNPNRTKLKFNIETKFPGDNNSQIPIGKVKEHVNLLVQAIEGAKVADRTTIQSFYLPALPIVKGVNPKLKTSALFSLTYFQGAMMKLGLENGTRREAIQKTLEVKADIISPYFLYVTEEFVQEVHSHNLSVIPWTVNDPKVMRKLMDAGVDGIISDYPDRLSIVIKN